MSFCEVDESKIELISFSCSFLLRRLLLLLLLHLILLLFVLLPVLLLLVFVFRQLLTFSSCSTPTLSLSYFYLYLFHLVSLLVGLFVFFCCFFVLLFLFFFLCWFVFVCQSVPICLCLRCLFEGILALSFLRSALPPSHFLFSLPISSLSRHMEINCAFYSNGR